MGKKYKFKIIKPKSNRMLENIKIKVHFDDPWNDSYSRYYNISKEDEFFEIELDEKYQYTGHTSIMDGAIFWVQVIYENSTGTRNEIYDLNPIDCLVN